MTSLSLLDVRHRRRPVAPHGNRLVGDRLYFGILLGVAWWVVRKGKDSAADYFLAGRNLGWWIIGASIFASNIGSEHVVGLAGAGATSGVAHGALRIARLVPAGAGLGVRAVLHALARSSPCRSSWSGASAPRPAMFFRSFRSSRSSSRRLRWAFSRAAWSSARCCPNCVCTIGGPTSTASGSARSW